MSYREYQAHIMSDIDACLEGMCCQPILFIGSGISQRYFSAPTWDGLLEKAIALCPTINKPYAYYKQKLNDPIAIADELISPFQEFAWQDRKNFPEKLYDATCNADTYLKYTICNYISSITPSYEQLNESEYSREINSLRSINPHAIITTNYDTLIEKIFPDYTPIVGQKILHTNTYSIGEIFKIHGCVTNHDSIIITQADYKDFQAKKKYLSAKLLTFFAEHPLLFIGYSISDPNIKMILSDIDEILTPNDETIPNIYILNWKMDIEDVTYPRETMIPVEKDKHLRIKRIVANDFDWVFSAFGKQNPIEFMRPQLLRALLARTYNVVRHDIPTRSIQVNYETLEQAVNNDEDFLKLLGITSINDASKVNLQFPYSLTQVAKKLGYGSWHKAHELFNRIKRDKHIDIKASDNKYHISVKAGEVAQNKKYSNDCVELLTRVRDGIAYEVHI